LQGNWSEELLGLAEEYKMAFNLKKSQKINDSVTPQTTAVPASSQKYNLSLEGKDIKNFNTLLETDHRPLGDSPKTQEGLLSEARAKHKSNEKITEGAIQDSTSELFPHRQFKNGEDNVDVAPINAISEAHDRKWRDAFSKANKGADTEFWDKFVGEQLDGEVTKIGKNLPQRGSQLANNPDRFGNLDGLPHNEDHSTNEKNAGKEMDIKPLNRKEKPLEITSSLRSADKVLFGIYLKANSENRELNAEEKEIVAAINNDKVQMLMTLAQMGPQMDPDLSKINPQTITPADREADFLDSNPTIDDPNLWAQQSGFDPNAQGEELSPLPHDGGDMVENSDFPGFPNAPSSSSMDVDMGNEGQIPNPGELPPPPQPDPLSSAAEPFDEQETPF
jgi:hypothetical protein